MHRDMHHAAPPTVPLKMSNEIIGAWKPDKRDESVSQDIGTDPQWLKSRGKRGGTAAIEILKTTVKSIG